METQENLESTNEVTLPPWHDITGGESHIEKLNFPADRKWLTCKIKLKGLGSSWIFGDKPHSQMKIMLNGNQVFDDAFEGEREVIRQINAEKEVVVSGILKPALRPHSAEGEVTVTCTYDPNSLIPNKETATWKDDARVISCIDNLFLPATHPWKRCEIKVEGHKDKLTGCMVTLIAGSNRKQSEWCVLTGTDTKVYTINLDEKNVPLVVAGYITFHIAGNENGDNQLEGEEKNDIEKREIEGEEKNDVGDPVGAGATITLTGMYK